MDRDPRAKVCAACGRAFSWRRKWASSWSQVRYCSARCRTRRLRRVDVALEDAIRVLLSERAGTICPSEAARRVGRDDWRQLMEPTRAAGRRMAAREEVRVLQSGRPVDPTQARGPIRFGRGRAFPAPSRSRRCAPGG